MDQGLYEQGIKSGRLGIRGIQSEPGNRCRPGFQVIRRQGCFTLGSLAQQEDHPVRSASPQTSHQPVAGNEHRQSGGCVF